MRRFAVVGAALLAVLALTAVMASSAVAALPEFLPGSGTFTGTSGKGELQIKGGGTIKCEKDKPLGTITGPKTASIDVHFEECKALGFAANSVDDKEKAGVILVKGTATLCYLSAALKTVGLTVQISPEPLEIEVPTAKQKILVKGTVIGEVKPVNKSQTTGEVTFTQKEGVPGLEKCEGTAAAQLLASEAGKEFKPAGEKTSESLVFSTAVEVMA